MAESMEFQQQRSRGKTMVESGGSGGGVGGYWDGFVNDGDAFHNVINVLDFPMESLEGDNAAVAEDWAAQFQRLGPLTSEILQGLAPVSLSKVHSDTPNNCAQSAASSEQKQLPNVTKTSSTTGRLNSHHLKTSSSFQTQSPTSVVESSSSSCSAEKSTFTSQKLLVPVRTRTKVPRYSTFTKWHLIPPITPPKNILKEEQREKKKKKAAQLSNDNSKSNENSSPQQITSKKCAHCQITKTPQWREGPMGPKTLCNACGVRYRSGRLFPEYRPAASPTFVPTLNSNCHKKVIEIRNNSVPKTCATEMDAAAMSPPPEFVPMSSYLFDRI